MFGITSLHTIRTLNTRWCSCNLVICVMDVLFLPPTNEVAGRLCFYTCLWFCSWFWACVAGGMCGRGHAWQGGMHGRGVCMAGGHVWQGMCMAGGLGGACPLTDTTRYSQWAGSTHPTGMYSCICWILDSIEWNKHRCTYLHSLEFISYIGGTGVHCSTCCTSGYTLLNEMNIWNLHWFIYKCMNRHEKSRDNSQMSLNELFNEYGVNCSWLE